MATIKSHTDLEQSRKLAEILPLESADFTLVHTPKSSEIKEEFEYHIEDIPYSYYSGVGIPCWSLAALLGVLPCNLKIALAINDYWQGNTVKYKYAIGSVDNNNYDCYADNPVDACYELILKLHELKK